MAMENARDVLGQVTAQVDRTVFGQIRQVNSAQRAFVIARAVELQVRFTVAARCVDVDVFNVIDITADSLWYQFRRRSG